ncbi:maleylpyruvate isomerase family mycothiol-dependent enzyme [Streptomyces violaceorubidus]
MLLGELPAVVAKRADAPRSSAVVFDVHGPVEFLRTIRVDIQGRGTLESSPALGPAATLTLDWETYFRLAVPRDPGGGGGPHQDGGRPLA